MSRTPTAQEYKTDTCKKVGFGLYLGLSRGDCASQSIAERVTADVAIGAEGIFWPSSESVDGLNGVDISPVAQLLDMLPAISIMAKRADLPHHPGEAAGFDNLGMHQQQLAAQGVTLPTCNRSVDQVAANSRR